MMVGGRLDWVGCMIMVRGGKGEGIYLNNNILFTIALVLE